MNQPPPIAPEIEPKQIQAMFGRVAPRYDLLNHVLCGGVDRRWRRFLSRRVHETQPDRLLDLATGSGDVALALRDDEAPRPAKIFGADFCLPMLALAKAKGVTRLCAADGLRLPFQDRSFDAITIAFGVRNLADRARGFGEMRRVLRPGGSLFILEFSQPWKPLRPVYFAYLRYILPRFAQWFTPERGAYEYLSESIRAFPEPEALASELRQAGFAQVRYWRLTGGVVVLHRVW